MRCHSCEDKKTPADCLVSPQFNLEKFNLEFNIEGYYDSYKFGFLHRRSQLACLADCFLMDGNWCDSRLPSPRFSSTADFLSFANQDATGVPYETVAQTRFYIRPNCVLLMIDYG